MLYGQGKMERTEAGAKRESNEGRGRFDLLPFEAVEAWAKWSEEGAKKYGDRNWEDGLSVKDSINRMVRHAIKAANGWTDEDHLAAVMWNAACAITMMQRRPDLNDHPWKTDISGDVIIGGNVVIDGAYEEFLKYLEKSRSKPGKEARTQATPWAVYDTKVVADRLYYRKACEENDKNR